MRISRIYLDTFVIVGSHDVEFSSCSNRLMKDFRLKNYLPVLSQLTFDKISKAPKTVQNPLTVLLGSDPEILEITEDVLELSENI